MRRFAIFDLDHTLLPFDTQALFCNFVLKRHRWRVILHAIFLPVALARGFGIVTNATARRALHTYLWRMPASTLHTLAREFAHTSVVRWTYPELMAEIRRHQERHTVLVLNTASPDFYVRPIADALGFAYCIATPFDIGDRMPLMPRLPAGENRLRHKLSAMLALVPDMKTLSADERAQCHAYSDSVADLPLLRFAGLATVVHPSLRLATIAAEEGWTVLTPARPYHSRAAEAVRAVLQLFGLHAQ